MYPTSRVLKALALTSLCAAFVACGSKSNDNKNQPVTPQEVAEGQGILSASGNQVALYKAGPIEAKILASETPSAMSVDEVFAMYPSIANRYSFLGTINKAIKTDANTLDLYSNDVLVLTLAHDTAADTWSIANSSNGLTVDKIAFMESFADQSGSHPDSLHFVLSECTMVQQQAPAQAPTQEEAKPEEKPVEQQQAQAQQAQLPEAQAQAKLMGAPEAKPEEQVKPEAKPEVQQAQEEAKPEEKPVEEVKPEQKCASVEALLWLEEQKVEVQQQQQQQAQQEEVKPEAKPEAQQAPVQEAKPEQKPEAQQAPTQAQQAPSAQQAPTAQGAEGQTIVETPTVAQHRGHYNGYDYSDEVVTHEKPGYETPYTMFPNSGLPPF